MNKVASYIKNMGKSVTYAAIDEVKKNAESSANFVETNKDLFKSIYSAGKNYKKTVSHGRLAIRNSKIFEAADAGIKATLEDIKTGNFYNTKRIDEFNTKAAGSLLSDDEFEDFDMDFSFDDEDFDFEDDSDSGSSTPPITKGDVYVGSAVSRATQMSAELTANTIAKTGKFIVDANKASTAILLSQNAELMAGVRTSISGVHNSINDIYKFATSTIQTHAENSKTFFEQNTNMMQEQTAILKEMLEMQRELYKKEDSKSSSSGGTITYDDVVDAYGMPDLKEYAKIIRQNIKKASGSTGDMLLGDTFGEGSNMLMAMVASPLSFIPTTIVKSLIPKTLAKAGKELDASLSGAFSTMIARFNKMAKNDGWDDHPILSFIGKIFGIDNNIKTTLDTKNYNKGPVPFDGIVRKSIVEVIPEHLARIESILSGQTERTYDYQEGKWIKTEDLKKQFQEMKDSYVTGAFDDIKSEMYDYFRAMRKKKNFNERDQKELEGNFFKIMQEIFEDGGYFNPEKPDEKYQYFPDMDKFLEIYKRTTKSKQIGLAGRVMSKRSAMDREMKKLEKEGSKYGLLFNGSDFNSHLKINDQYGKTIVEKNNASLLFTTDKNNRTLFDYLAEIDLGIKDIIVNGIEVSKGGKRGKKNTKRKEVSLSYKSSKLDEARLDYDKIKYENYPDRPDWNENDPAMLDEVQAQIDQEAINDNSEYGNTPLNKWMGNLDEKVSKKLKNVKGNSTTSKFIYGGWKDKLNATFKFLIDATKKPAELLTGVLDKANLAIYNLLFEKEGGLKDKQGKKIKGLMNAMLFKIENGLTELSDRFKENILDPLADKYGLKDKYGDLKDKLKEKFNANEYVRAIKSEFKGAFNFVKDKTKEAYEPVIRQAKQTIMTADQRKADDRYATNKKYMGMVNINDLINNNLKHNNPMNAFMETLDQGRDKEKEAQARNKSIERTKRKQQKKIAKRNRSKSNVSQQATESSDDPDPDIQSHADGIGYVAKSGLTAISEGEAIIPADLNPFNPNRNKVNRKQQRANEKKIKSKFTKNLIDDIFNDIGEYAEGTVSEKFRADIEKINAKEYEDGLFIRGANRTAAAAQNFVSKSMSISEDDDKKIRDITGEALGQILDKGPMVVAKSVLGGTLGLLSGVVGGPLIGAGIGAATAIVKDSDKLKDFLFGKEIIGKDGKSQEREGGKLASKETQKVIKQYFPDMTKFGIAGAVTGLITPLGPIGGLMVGSAIGFAKNNKRIHEALFGDEDGLFNKNRKEAIKKGFPTIAAGALGGMLLGPFGLVGNAMLGSAVGMVATTDEFKETVFGKMDENGKRVGGLIGTIKESVIDPLKEFSKTIIGRVEDFVINDMIEPLKGAVDPIAEEIKRAVMFIPNLFVRTVSDHIGRPLEAFVKEKFIEPLTGIAKKVFGFAMKPLKFALSAPSKAIGWVGNNLRAKQIVQGRASYMTAQERLDFAEEHQGRMARYKHSLTNKFGLVKNTDYTGFDETIAGLNADQLGEVKSTLTAVTGGDKALSKEMRGVKRDIFNLVDQYFSHKGGFGRRSDRKKILDAINHGRYPKAQELIAKAKGKDGKVLSPSEFDEISKQFAKLTGKYDNIKNRRNNLKKQGKDPLKQALKNMGLNVSKLSDTQLKRITKNIDTEIDARGNVEAGTQEAKDQDTMAALNSTDTQIFKVLEKIREGIDKLVNIERDEEGNPIQGEGETKKQQKKFNKKQSRVQEAYQDGKKKKGEAVKNKIKTLEGLGYKDILKDNKELKDAIAKAPDQTFNMIVDAAKNGNAFAEEDLIRVLGITDEKSINRLSKLTKFTAIPKGALDKFLGNGHKAAMRPSVFGRVLEDAAAGVNFMNEDGTLNEDIFNAAIRSKSKKKFADHLDNPKNKFSIKMRNAFRDAKAATFTAMSGHMSNDHPTAIKKLKKLGIIPDYMTENEALQTSIHTLMEIIKKPDVYKESKKDQQTQEDVESSGSANVGFMAKARRSIAKKAKKLKTVFTQYGPKQYYEDEQGNIETPDTAENNATDEKEKDAQETQKGIFSGLSSLKDGIFNIFSRKSNDEEDGKKEPWWKRLLSGFFSSPIGKGIAFGSVLIGIHKLVEWWQNPDSDNNPVKKMFLFIGDKITDVAPDLFGKIKEAVPNMIESFVSNLGGSLEWLIGDVLPIAVASTFKSLPKILTGLFDGLKIGLGSILDMVVHRKEESNLEDIDNAGFITSPYFQNQDTDSNIQGIFSSGQATPSQFYTNFVSNNNVGSPSINIENTNNQSNVGGLMNFASQAAQASKNVLQQSGIYKNSNNDNPDQSTENNEDYEPDYVDEAILSSNMLPNDAVIANQQNNTQKSNTTQSKNKSSNNTQTFNVQQNDKSSNNTQTSNTKQNEKQTYNSPQGFTLNRYGMTKSADIYIKDEDGKYIEFTDEMAQEAAATNTIPQEVYMKTQDGRMLLAKYSKDKNGQYGYIVQDQEGFTETDKRTFSDILKNRLTRSFMAGSTRFSNVDSKAYIYIGKGIQKFSKIIPLPGAAFAGNIIGGGLKGIGNLQSLGTETAAKLGKDVFKTTLKEGPTAGFNKLKDNLKTTITDPANAKKEKIMLKIKQHMPGKIGEEAREKAAKEAAEKAAEKTTKEATEKATKEITEKVTKEITEKAAEETTEAVTKEVVGAANEGILTKIKNGTFSGQDFLEVIKQAIDWVVDHIGNLKSAFSAKSIKGLGSKFVERFAEQGLKGMTKSFLKTAATKVSSWIMTLFSALAVDAGYSFFKGVAEADGILGFRGTDSGQKLLAGLAHTIDATLTFGVLHHSDIGNWLLEVFGYDMKEIEQRRQEAAAECEAYNLERDENLSIEEFLIKDTFWNKYLDPVGNMLNHALDGTINAGGKIITGTGNVLGGTFDIGKGLLTADLDTAWEGLQKAGGGLWDATGGAAWELGKGVFDIGKEGFKIGKNAWDDFTGWLGFGSDDEPTEEEKTEIKKNSQRMAKTLGDFGKKAINTDLSSVKEIFEENKKANKSSDLTDKNGNPTSPAVASQMGIETMFGAINNTAGEGLADLNNNMLKAMPFLDYKYSSLLGLRDKDGNLIPMSKLSTMSSSELMKLAQDNESQSTKKSSMKSLTDTMAAAALAGIKAVNTYHTGRGTGEYTSQVDPSIANMSFNVNGDSVKQTVRDSGCGPIAAQTVLNAYTGRGPSVKDAVNFALNGGYKEKDAGVTPDYFGDYLGNYGIATAPTDNMNNVYNQLAAGRPTILMGVDPDGGRKQGTPYGPNSSHYVVASGIDSKGNIIIQDPESKTPNKKYNAKKVLSKTQLGITTSLAGRGINSLMNKIKNGRNFKGFGKGNDTKDQDLGIWSPLTAKQIDDFMKSYPGGGGDFAGKGSYFVKAAEVSGLDPRYILAHAAIESGWGTSEYAHAGNFFGIGAFDSNPDNALKYGNSSMESGIVNGASWIRKNYYDAGQKTLYEMQHPENGWHIYATDKDWADKIASIMDAMPENTNATYHESKSTGATNSSGNSNSIFGFLDGISSMASEVNDKYLTPGFDALNGVVGAYTGGLTDVIFGSSGDSESDSTNNAGSGDVASSKEFRDKYIGKKTDVDGVPEDQPVQCVDLFKQYSKDLAGMPNFSLGGDGYADNIIYNFDQIGLNKYYDKVDLNQAQYGDWLIWKKNSKGAPSSHVAMFEESAGNGRVKVLGQNQDPNNPAANEINMSTDGVIGVLRLKSGKGTGKLPIGGMGTDSTVSRYLNKAMLNQYDKPKVVKPKKGHLTKDIAVNMRPVIPNARGLEEIPIVSTTSNSNMTTGQYDQLLSAIIQALLTIVDNTDNLSKIVELLSNNLGIKVSEQELKSTNKGNTEAIKQKLMNAMKNNGGSKNGFGNMLMEKDNSYLINAMNSIARG